jgi:hypothetical protein
MDPIRVQAIEEWPEPESYRDIQVFLGFANFYYYFIYNYSRLVHMLNAHMLQASKPLLEIEGEGGLKLKLKLKSRLRSRSKLKLKLKLKLRKGPTKWYKP